ncbi:DUF4148 domain-containing protein [Ramlibacter lithotrophicus]|nr:DUF4148 domain-containing protein [Ramlibacter lithotrophicus]
MNVRKMLVVFIPVAAMSVPAFADQVLHAANTEQGYVNYPEHAKAGRSRAEVIAEMEAAKKDGTWEFIRRGAPLPVKGGVPLTRAQVEAELLQAQKHPSWSARRVGAPVGW